MCEYCGKPRGIDNRGRARKKFCSISCKLAGSALDRVSASKSAAKSSRYLGVCYDKSRHGKMWRAQLTVNGRLVWKTYFETEDDAARNRDAIVRSLLPGDDRARFNFPRAGERGIR